ncbi:hypothetical protein KDU71_05230 [Carboxylicivirga sediminis]|uniref:Lipoprotein n=1 Tax=Carboxylicivirga sediminis TaxID=2006564 RepID=A0A941F391_9BACT|nr:hypothetical protein [Carboxylicivirga sediminis]MBR8534955.1 hypothetical protein [Carboxylicivirga sediminis]
MKREESIFMLALFVFLLLIASCQKQLSHPEFLEYINNPDNGLLQEKEINNVSVSLQYWPQELVTYQEFQGLDSISTQVYLNELANYKQYHYIKLKLSAHGQGLLHAYVRDRFKYSQLVNTLSFGMGQNAYLIKQPTDTLEFVDCFIPRYYGINTSTDLMLIYKADKDLDTDFRFQLKDLDIGTGELSFTITKDAILNIPDLIIE